MKKIWTGRLYNRESLVAAFSLAGRQKGPLPAARHERGAYTISTHVISIIW